MILFFFLLRLVENFCFRWPRHVGVGFGFFHSQYTKMYLSFHFPYILFLSKKSNFFEISYLMNHFNHSVNLSSKSLKNSDSKAIHEFYSLLP